MGDACTFLCLATDNASAECKQVARTVLARAHAVGPIRIREAYKLETVVRTPPSTLSVG
jgi:hypothetical protein